MLDLPPLRTHGISEEKWIPPTKEPFIIYEPSDEEWCRYCGIGKVVTILADLYDVRDEENNLIGYTRHNPADVTNHYGYIEIAIARSERGYFSDLRIAESPPIERVRIEQRVWAFGDHRNQDRFVCWYARLQDAEKLVRSPFIDCIGEDEKNEFCYKIARRLHERMDRY